MINQTGIFFFLMKNAVVFNRKFARLDALSCIVLFRIVSVDSIIVQFLYSDIDIPKMKQKGNIDIP